MKLKRIFFNRNTVTVAKDLLGKYLVRRVGKKIIAAKITETEAYCGRNDLACHASKGLTERTKVMFGPPGHAYVYLIYGMYHCLNIVTREEGHPEAVLIRSVELQNYGLRITDYKKNTQCVMRNRTMGNLNGPGKLCRKLKIDKKFNGADLCKSREIWIEGFKEKPSKIKKGKRIGVDYAGKWKDKLWRFSL
ncbi:MAG: 3-methyladenine DNA glycosylase [Candidatus Yanofskybacteria bacterium RIFCSPHIGHO2_01_FULL_43_42]|uniref:Putative 3-methyladenine DNA glycosylase n=1 Tax=Candidatus Yanofskybacteria bacterium RIFCSPLOWO2_01_FULL_43_22 TaxID=1802695 RepID=A0A1F8GH46_9BACT|nr:MAG: 3-methyladenine DNA glycosylase [Candidatus Yanofskybacteria bacterium RIFCSPHIGHO2_01_FULL_43_42]OGN12915.1 MAG: 3-methyladenine DNA glycosylase [Candidatus Yanofskybacteria bacterium RIFCSPHIGHO2_02_FULL_43_17]OGN24006.1 MAG: 3-methyladenine DNA glycosylase [Candidatus Yanofskybacteria bacterium RIFCSPLOWO2_01_FULL_43_22]